MEVFFNQSKNNNYNVIDTSLQPKGKTNHKII
ncbi:MAG: hypothetical protein ACJAQ2_002215 [Vicingaceae bacterium]